MHVFRTNAAVEPVRAFDEKRQLGRLLGRIGDQEIHLLPGAERKVGHEVAGTLAARGKWGVVIDGEDLPRFGPCTRIVNHVDRQAFDIGHVERQLPGSGPRANVCDRGAEPEPRLGEPEIDQIAGDRLVVLGKVEPVGVARPQALVGIFEVADVGREVGRIPFAREFQRLRRAGWVHSA